MNIIHRAIGAIKLSSKANAPTIMVVAGIGAMTVGTVLACKKTLKVEEVLQDHVADLEILGDQATRRDKNTVITRAALDLTRLYAVPATCFIGGAALVFGGHRVMLKRNATLAIAFTALQKTFDTYRQRVVEEFGEHVDQGMLSGHKAVEVVDPETGKSETVQSRDWDQENVDLYNRVFEQGATSMWEPDLGVNKMFVAQQQRYAQQRLGMRGYLYLSEVYEALGFPESDISRVVGWKVTTLPDGSRSIPNVDFGLDKPIPDDWKYNRQKAIYLDFNCQGLIVGGKVQKILETA